jgi:hypothetical protein
MRGVHAASDEASRTIVVVVPGFCGPGAVALSLACAHAVPSRGISLSAQMRRNFGTVPA